MTVKYLRLPTIKRCNTHPKFPYEFDKYRKRIFKGELPPGYIALDYKTVGKTRYHQLYTLFRAGCREGAIYWDKRVNRWRYAVKKGDLYARTRGIAGRAKAALTRLEKLGLPDDKYVPLFEAARLIGFANHTLKANYLDMNLLAETPSAQDYIDMKLHPNTKLIVSISELKLWLAALASGQIKSTCAGISQRPKNNIWENRLNFGKHDRIRRDREARRVGWSTPAYRLRLYERQKAKKLALKAELEAKQIKKAENLAKRLEREARRLAKTSPDDI